MKRSLICTALPFLSNFHDVDDSGWWCDDGSSVHTASRPSLLEVRVSRLGSRRHVCCLSIAGTLVLVSSSRQGDLGQVLGKEGNLLPLCAFKIRFSPGSDLLRPPSALPWWWVYFGFKPLYLLWWLWLFWFHDWLASSSIMFDVWLWVVIEPCSKGRRLWDHGLLQVDLWL